MPARRPPSQVERARAFGERVRSLRRERKITQRELAARIPISAGHLSRIETGDYGPPSDEVIERIAEVLATDRIELLRLARRDPGGRGLEEAVLSELRGIRGAVTARGTGARARRQRGCRGGAEQNLGDGRQVYARDRRRPDGEPLVYMPEGA